MLGLVAVLLLYLPLYPSIGGDGEMQKVIDSLPSELVSTLGYEDIATGAGYVQATFFGLMGFVLLTIAATSWGSASIAGAEESGRLELELAHGVARTAFAVQSAAAILLKLLVLGIVAALVVVALDDSAELGLNPLDVVAVTASLTGLALLTAMVALAVGAVTGRRLFATAAGAGIAVIGYALNAIANQVADLEGLRTFSPYAWAFGADPLAEGVDWGGLALLGGASLLSAAIGVAALRRRDVVGG